MSRVIGNLGENKAVSLLVSNGYKVIERNYLTRQGEIDIVAWDHKCLVFVEVKLRKNDRFGAPSEFIGKSKIEKILKAAKSYLFENEINDMDWRIDAVTINIENGESQIIKNIYVEGIN